ncbi:MAG: sigma-54 dependent transcriptional regulator [Deltaproteobacteria bacterium]
MKPLTEPANNLTQARILVIDDDEGMCYTLTRMAEEEGHEAQAALTLKNGMEMIRSGTYDVVFLDVRLPDGSGIKAIPSIQTLPAPPEIIIVTGYGDKDGAKTALKSGVWDYIEKPARINSLRLSLKRALQYRRQRKNLSDPLSIDRSGIVGTSSKIAMCLTLIAHAAQSDASVLISGETGTGKELFARAIHNNSFRSDRPFVVVDCASLTENLTESILFGHAKGAFTGADKASKGLVRMADGGTLFLDEVGELPLPIQKTFLRVLQERRFLPVGTQEEVTSDFRLVSATNSDLDADAETARFRKDLLFRLRSIVIELPPLRDRKNDIRQIVQEHVEGIHNRSGLPTREMSEEFLETLATYDWPGNVRELINAVDHALAMEPNCPTLYPKHLPEYIRICNIGSKPVGIANDCVEIPASSLRGKDSFLSLKHYRKSAIESVERRYLSELMSRYGGDIEKACKVSGLKRARLYQLLNKYRS